jgi:hypothetical protein
LYDCPRCRRKGRRGKREKVQRNPRAKGKNPRNQTNLAKGLKPTLKIKRRTLVVLF